MNATLINTKRVNINRILTLLPQKIYVIPLTLALLYSTVSFATEQSEINNNVPHSNISQHDASQYISSPFSSGKSKGHHSKMKRMIKKLELNSEQQEKIKAIKLLAKGGNKALFESMKNYRNELNILIRAEAFDEHAVTSLYQSYQSNLMAIALAKAKTQHSILQVLTDEQQAKWFTMSEKHRTRK